MARGTEEQEQTADVSSDFPYREFMSHPAWAVVDKAISDLEANDDLELKTARRYVIGSLVRSLSEKGLLPPPAPQQLPANERGGRYRWVLVYEFSEEKAPTKRTTLKKVAK